MKFDVEKAISRIFGIFVISCFVALVLTFSALIARELYGQAVRPERNNFLSVLKPGQFITMKDNAGRIEISMFDEFGTEFGTVLGHKVVEVGQDWLTIEDAAEVTETRVPIYSIKSIVKLKIRNN